jgi:hypothetical protein
MLNAVPVASKIILCPNAIVHDLASKLDAIPLLLARTNSSVVRPAKLPRTAGPSTSFA